MAELVDAHDSKSCGEILESSILSFGTETKNPPVWVFSFLVAKENRTPERCRATQGGERGREAMARQNFRKKILVEADSLLRHDAKRRAWHAQRATNDL